MYGHYTRENWRSPARVTLSVRPSIVFLAPIPWKLEQLGSRNTFSRCRKFVSIHPPCTCFCRPCPWLTGTTTSFQIAPRGRPSATMSTSTSPNRAVCSRDGAHSSTRGGGRMMLDELARPRAVRVLADGRGRGGGLSYSNGGLTRKLRGIRLLGRKGGPRCGNRWRQGALCTPRARRAAGVWASKTGPFLDRRRAAGKRRRAYFGAAACVGRLHSTTIT